MVDESVDEAVLTLDVDFILGAQKFRGTNLTVGMTRTAPILILINNILILDIY